MVELKPCPFCGGEAEIIHSNLYMDEIVRVKCKKCSAGSGFVMIDHPLLSGRTGKLDETTRYTRHQAEEKAVAAWNRREGGE